MNRKDPPSLGEAIARIIADPDSRVGPPTNLPESPLAEDISEAQFQQRVIDFAGRNGWLCYHTHDSRRSNPGYPDLTLVRRGEIVFAELKVPPNECSEEQVRWLDALRETGAAAGVWRPEDWPKIQEVLK